MRTGWQARIFFILFLLTAVFSTLSANPTVYMQVRRLDTDELLTKPYVYLYLVEGEAVALEMTGFFDNVDEDLEYTCWLRRTPETDEFPAFIRGWEDQKMLLSPGDEKELSNIMYIWPDEVGRFQLSVEVALRVENDGIIANRFTINVIVNENPFDLPVILPEPLFTRGLSNEIRWIPADGSPSQDVYYFDVNHPDALQKAMQQRRTSFWQAKRVQNPSFSPQRGKERLAP